MNKWNQLVVSLDHVLGMNNKERSTFKKLSQDYDERTNELFIVIEYRPFYSIPVIISTRWSAVAGFLSMTGYVTPLSIKHLMNSMIVSMA